LQELHASRRQGVGTLLYLVYVLPLIGPLARWIHIQLSVVAMTVLLYMIWHVAKSDRSENLLLTEKER
jgi:uncharacterized membrane protein YqjE